MKLSNSLRKKVQAHKVELEDMADSSKDSEDSIDSKGDVKPKRDKTIPKPVHHLKVIKRIFREENLRMLVDETKDLDLKKMKKQLGSVNGLGLRTTSQL